MICKGHKRSQANGEIVRRFSERIGRIGAIVRMNELKPVVGDQRQLCSLIVSFSAQSCIICSRIELELSLSFLFSSYQLIFHISSTSYQKTIALIQSSVHLVISPFSHQFIQLFFNTTNKKITSISFMQYNFYVERMKSLRIFENPCNALGMKVLPVADPCFEEDGRKYRVYPKEPADAVQERVKRFYYLQHSRQTVEFVRNMVKIQIRLF